jgi:predicted SAM-dependent methyltransferase
MNNRLKAVARLTWRHGILPKFAARIRTSFRIRQYLREHKVRRLNVGCGPYLRAGWINGDINPRCQYYIDANVPLPLPSESIDFIFSEHFVEHLTLPAFEHFLRESYRVLRADGVIRIGTPDLDLLVRTYLQSGEDVPRLADVMSRHRSRFYRTDPAVALTSAYWLNDKLRLWGEHQFIYDFETLDVFLRRAGFRDIISCKYGESHHKELAGLEAHAEDCEWMKTGEVVIVEGRKL